MQLASRLAATIVLGSLAAACATPERLQARLDCAREWEMLIPPRYQPVFATGHRRATVPDGTSSCTTRGDTRSCRQGTRTEWVPYTEVLTVDVNAGARNLRIARCTDTRCLDAYGNAECAE